MKHVMDGKRFKSFVEILLEDC